MPDDATNETTTSSSSSSASALASKLTHQCRLILSEIDVFQNALASRFRKQQQRQHLVDTRVLRSNVVSELKILEKLTDETQAIAEERLARKSNDDGDNADLEMKEKRILHTLRSSNLQYHATVWTVAKQHCDSVVAFSRRFYLNEEYNPHRRTQDVASDKEEKRVKKPPTNKGKRDKRKSVFVDVIYGNGEDWLKVSAISMNRLLFEMAAKGWDMDDSEDDQEIQNRVILRPGRGVNGKDIEEEDSEDDEDQIELIKMASDMMKAARATRVRYKTPRVRIIAPRLEEGNVPEVDRIINTIRSYGVTIDCGGKVPDIVNDGAVDERDPNLITEDDLPLSRMLPNPFKEFTDTINVDCTLLLACVSDLSHSRQVTPSPNYHRAIIKQIEVEDELPLLPAEIWPAMVNRQLVCTQVAVTRMKEIVDTIGTESEKTRTAILLAEGDNEGLEKDELLRKFQQFSDHQIPNQLNFPIKVVDARADIDAALQQNKFPPVVHKVSEILTDINHNVFLYGWARDIVTITSNRTVVKQIERVIEENRGGDDTLRGPPTWVCDTARSLIGKDKNRKP